MRSLFSGEVKFDQAKFKVQLQLALTRMNIQRQKISVEVTSLKREIAQFLRAGDQEKARVRCVNLIQKDNLLEALQRIQQCVSTLRMRYDILLSQRTCPSELKEACCTIVWAAPYLSEVTELVTCRAMLLNRYGKAFPSDCQDCNAISPQIMSRLQSDCADDAIVRFYLAQIAKENQIPGWDSLDGLADLPDLDSAPPMETPIDDSADPRQCVAYGEGLVSGTAGAGSIWTIEARDSLGRQRRTGGDTFAVYVSGPDELHIYGEVRDNGDGTYAAGFVPPVAGGYAIAIHLRDTPIGTGEPWTVFIGEGGAGPADAAHCKAEGAGLETGTVGVQSSFVITACDANGRKRDVGGDVFKVYVAGPNETRIYGDVQDNGNGTYNCTYTPPLAGGYAIAIHLQDTPIGNGQPWELFVNEAAKPKEPERLPPAAKVTGVGRFASAKSGLNAGALQHSVVLDCGSGCVKAGLGGEEAPRAMFPTIVGRPKYKNMLAGAAGGAPDVYVGDEARKKRGILSLSRPVDHGAIVDFNGMESVWQHTLMNELRIDPRERPVLIVQPVLAPAGTAEKTAQAMFEKFEVPGFYTTSQSALALYGTGAETGIVLDCGDGVTHCVPVVNGAPIRHAAARLEVAGRDVTDYMVKLLAEDGILLSSSTSERDIVESIKEHLAYVALDCNAETAKPRDSVGAPYTMPDGEVVRPTRARFQASEILFNPGLIGKDTAGVSKLIAEAIAASGNSEVTKNIILVGGSARMQGFADRVKADLRNFGISGANVLSPENPQTYAWLGGSVLAGKHAEFCDMCVSKKQYEEYGPSILDRIQM